MKKNIFTICTIIFVLLFVVQNTAQQLNQNYFNNKLISNIPAQSNVSSPELIHINRDISFNETLVNLGLVQAVFLGGYVIGQYDNIKENGSFKNWYTNMTKTHFDKDSYDYNIITHIGNAHYAYLFYRSRGHTKINSFVLTTIGSTVFEFLIETVTEPPSIQDLWQTPVLGSLLGMCTESLSLYLLNRNHIVTDVLGYIFNPFTILPFSYYETRTLPVITDKYKGVSLSISL